MNSTDQQSETSQKKAICIIQLAIVYSVLTLTCQNILRLTQ